MNHLNLDVIKKAFEHDKNKISFGEKLRIDQVEWLIEQAENTEFYKEQYRYVEKEKSEWVKRYNDESSQKVKYRNAFECLYEKATSKNS